MQVTELSEAELARLREKLQPVIATHTDSVGAETVQQVQAAIDAVRSPSFGVFHRTPAPDAPPFVTVGATVEAGQTLCLIEAMKVFTAITAPQAGTVEAILAESGEEVEAGQPLFRLRA